MYDAIVVGARAAGSPTAMLLARKGYRVLLVDRATFPSDTMSTHQIQLLGMLALRRWGLLDRVLATGLPPAHHLIFDSEGVVVDGAYPTIDGLSAVYSPRRYLLDKILVDAAVEAGVELREGFITEALIWENGCVAGVRGRTKDGGSVTERARMVIGADGKHSLVAKAVDAPKYDEVPPLTCAYYSYWENVPVTAGEIHGRGRCFIGLWPTNHDQTMIFVSSPITEFDRFRSDVEGSYLAAINRVPELAERVRNGRRAERIMGTADLPNFYRKPFGPGWALVGDAGFIKDPISAMGISDAFRDAELLADALDAGFAGREPLDSALSQYEAKRNAASKPHYDFTVSIPRTDSTAVEQVTLFRALTHNPAAAAQFSAMMTGVVKPTEFFTPQNLFRILGVGGMAKIMLGKMFQNPQRRAS
jgi:flavin-dependent dehydrogenase